MLSYRHVYHAGNHADVLKHCVLVEIGDYMVKKEKPLWAVDTHAGSGMYALTSPEATKNAEYKSGIIHLWQRQDLPEGLRHYMELVKSCNKSSVLTAYPGSAWLLQQLLRQQDKLHLFELHPEDQRHLKRLFKDDVRITLHETDGFQAIKSLLPPQPKRAFIHIDPPYEIKKDYQQVITSLQQGIKRFATGVYMVWYPLLNQRDAINFPDKLKSIGCDKWLNVIFKVAEPPSIAHSHSTESYGMFGSGVFVVNPPWQLQETLQAVLPYLVTHLTEGTGSFVVDTHGC